MTIDSLSQRVRIAGRALARAGLLHAYGHCSARLNDKEFLVSPAKPLGAVTPGDTCTVVPIDGPLHDGVLDEVRVHREIYRLRPDVNGVVRSMPSKAMTLGTLKRTPKARHGFGAYFHPAPALWDDPQLLRSDEQAAALAKQLGQGRCIFMRGNGVVMAGASIEEAVVLTWYAEDAVRVELDCMAAGETNTGLLSADEAAQGATWSGRILERMWDYLTHGDPELTA
jgi:HCOMODA/2-hydroxy-3-carboxy-muconic semialdehyde decarboxylase